MSKTLLIAALAEELGEEAIGRLSQRCDICFTGVGKLRAFEATLTALHKGDYDSVINVGTCGSMKHPFATILRPGRIAQGDIYLGEMFGTREEILKTGHGDTAIVSSDNFIGIDTPASQLQLLEPYDCMDMESYAIVRAIRFHAHQKGCDIPKIYMLKVVSDGADATVGEWEQRIASLRPILLKATEELLETI